MAAKKQKSEVRGQKTEVSLEQLLTDAGFQTLETPAAHVIHASIGNSKSETRNSKLTDSQLFDQAHAAFLQAAGNHVAYIDSRKFCTVPRPILIVHRRVAAGVEDVQNVEDEAGGTPAVPEDEAGKMPAVQEEPKAATGNEQPSTDN